MAEETVAVDTEAQESEKVTKERTPVNPFDKEPSGTHRSLAKYVTENSPVELTPEQAQAVLVLHGQWQASPERKAEREAEKAEKARLAEEAKAERERKAAERKAENERKAAEKKAKEAAKAAEANDDDSDLDAVDNSDDDTETEAPKPRRRRKAPATADA
ncbi:hypothetical protein SEA_LUCKYLEO_61 [Gordonia phage LuckyLeo]|nr:hypothetical protein SEA_LUCKYLEO_61 [Gordonia phage LuckyLeo]